MNLGQKAYQQIRKIKMQPQCPSSSIPQANHESDKKFEPNPKNKKLYATLAKHSRSPRNLEITPKDSVKLKSGKTFDICYQRDFDSLSDSSSEEEEHVQQDQEIDPKIIECFETQLAKLKDQRTLSMQSISQEKGNTYPQILELLQRKGIKMNFFKRSLKESFNRATMWQMYYMIDKKESEKEMDPEAVKILDQFFENERNKLNQLFPGELQAILTKTISCSGNSRSRKLMQVAKEVGQKYSNSVNIQKIDQRYSNSAKKQQYDQFYN